MKRKHISLPCCLVLILSVTLFTTPVSHADASPSIQAAAGRVQWSNEPPGASYYLPIARNTGHRSDHLALALAADYVYAGGMTASFAEVEPLPTNPPGTAGKHTALYWKLNRDEDRLWAKPVNPVYRIDESIGTTPTRWVNDVVTVASPSFARATVLNIGSSAVSVIPQQYEPGVSLTVTIQVTPTQGGVAYGVEDQPPPGWSVTAINESGDYDAVNHKVKWTFLDNETRLLSYDVTPPQDAQGSVAFTGMVSFDGAENKAIGLQP